MANKAIKQKRRDKQIAKLAKEGRIVKGVEIPKGALAADPDKQDHGGGFAVKHSYSDIHYACAGCRKKKVWTAQQQKRYFEVQKGNIYNAPKWCHKCHTKRIQERNKDESNA
jgi:hypothetical protein